LPFVRRVHWTIEIPIPEESVMTKKTMWLPLVGLSVIGMVTLVAWADDGQEEEVTLDQVPAAVKTTILRESAGDKITEIERETRNGKTVYEAEFLRDGKEIEIHIAPDGTVLGREVEELEDDEDDLTIDQLPEPARAALLKLAGGARIVEVEREREHGAMIYEAAWVKNGTQHEAEVTAEGALLELEETIPAEKAPAAVRAAIAKYFGAHTKVVVEETMIVVYEVEAKINGKDKELLIFPTGRVHEESDDDDEHDGDDDDDDDDDD
jgi:uncharacterized membrane protein YkoI